MNFPTLNRNYIYQKILRAFALLYIFIMDKRLRHFILLLVSSVILFITTHTIYRIKNHHIEKSIINLTSQTKELTYRLDLKQQSILVPQFETLIKTIGAQAPPLTVESCLSYVSACIVDKNKSNVTVNVVKQDIQSTHTIQSFDIGIQTSFDYEIFEVMQHILANPTKFGYTQLRELEIEQLFESTPIVKGHFVYDQLSFNP